MAVVTAMTSNASLKNSVRLSKRQSNFIAKKEGLCLLRPPVATWQIGCKASHKRASRRAKAELWHSILKSFVRTSRNGDRSSVGPAMMTLASGVEKAYTYDSGSGEGLPVEAGKPPGGS